MSQEQHVLGNEKQERATTDPAGIEALEGQHVLVSVEATLLQQLSAFQKKRESKAPLPNAGREQRGAMDIGTEEEDGHAGDGGTPTGPTQPEETGGPSSSNAAGHIPPYLTT